MNFSGKQFKNVSLLWFAQTVSQSGDSIYQLALIWLVLEITNSSIVTGFIAMCAYVPAVMFGLFSGVITDRFDRFKIMILSNLSQALIVMGIPLIIIMDHKSVFIICILAFLKSSCNTFFQPALNSFIPELFSKSNLGKINAIIVTSGQLAWMMGPFFAGLFIARFSFTGLFIIDSLTFLVSIFFLMFISKERKTTIKLKSTKWNDLLKGLMLLKKESNILIIILITFLNNIFIMGPAIIGIPILIKDVFKGDAMEFAFFEGFMAAGALIGSLIVSLLQKKMKNGLIWIVGLFLDGITMSFLYWAKSLEVGTFLIFIHGIAIPFIMVSRTSIIQTHTKNKYHGRFFSFVHLGVVGTTAISSALVGIILIYIKVDLMFLIIGIGGASCSLIALFYPKIIKLS